MEITMEKIQQTLSKFQDTQKDIKDYEYTVEQLNKQIYSLKKERGELQNTLYSLHRNWMIKHSPLKYHTEYKINELCVDPYFSQFSKVKIVNIQTVSSFYWKEESFDFSIDKLTFQIELYKKKTKRWNKDDFYYQVFQLENVLVF